MPANISIFGGQPEAAFALKPAWWDVGGNHVLDFVPNSEQMIQAAHLGWEVETQPIYDHDGLLIPGHSVTKRADTGLHLGVVSDSYRVVQNRDAFAFLDSLLQDGIMKYESAGSLRGGCQVWALARMPSIDFVTDDDTLVRYILWLNSHDGKGALFAVPTSVRVVCQNTAALAVRGQTGIRHKGNINAKLRLAHAILAKADVQFSCFRDNAQILASRKFSREQADEYITTLIPEPEGEGRSCSIRERKIEAIRTAFQADRNQLPSIKGTWWSIYNSVSEAVDHHNFYSFRGSKADNRMSSLLWGQGADFKREAFNLALAMSS